MPGSAPSRPPTTRWSEGTAVISRSKRKTRRARNTEKAAVAGASAMPTTNTSNRFQPFLKNARPCTMKRDAISTTKTAITRRSNIVRKAP